MTSLSPPPLAGEFATAPAPDGVRPTPATRRLVDTQVRALLSATESWHALPDPDRERMATQLSHIASYAAECARDVWAQSELLGQRPVIREREVHRGPLAQAAAARPRGRQQEPERPGKVNQVARVTKEILRAVAFPVFVADLIKGTFNAIIQANIQQMEQFGRLLENVSKTVDEFMGDNITDAQARDWLQQRYPDHVRVKDGKATPTDGADERPAPDFRRELNMPDGGSLDEDSIEEKLVPAARRRLAESRLQILSTMVMMGVNRIVVTGGKIRATMGFHIDATDKTHDEHATDVDFRAAAAGSFGFGPWSVSASTSFAYVSSTRQNSDSEIHVDTDLTGEVEIHFKSDYFPVERFANTGVIGRIQSNTAVPEANPLGDAPSAGGTVGAYQSPRARPRPASTSTLPPLGTLPEARMPTKPVKPEVERHVDAPKGSRWYQGGDEKAVPEAKPEAEKPADKSVEPADESSKAEKPADKPADKPGETADKPVKADKPAKAEKAGGKPPAAGESKDKPAAVGHSADGVEQQGVWA